MFKHHSTLLVMTPFYISLYNFLLVFHSKCVSLCIIFIMVGQFFVPHKRILPVFDLVGLLQHFENVLCRKDEYFVCYQHIWHSNCQWSFEDWGSTSCSQTPIKNSSQVLSLSATVYLDISDKNRKGTLLLDQSRGLSYDMLSSACFPF